jgi:3-hydroxyisobutyrate dehydrogenase-like beta-hydroxyacid dehydrogenase
MRAMAARDPIPPPERIGFVGLGIMGSRMAANLARAGCELTVFNRTRATADAWAAEHRVTVAETPAAVGAVSDIVISMVVDGDQVREVLLGEQGVAHRAARCASTCRRSRLHRRARSATSSHGADCRCWTLP